MERRRIYRTLKEWRKAQGFTSRQAAQYLRVSQGTYSRVENRKQVPRREVIETWVDQTGVPLESIMGLAS